MISPNSHLSLLRGKRHDILNIKYPNSLMRKIIYFFMREPIMLYGTLVCHCTYMRMASHVFYLNLLFLWHHLNVGYILPLFSLYS